MGNGLQIRHMPVRIRSPPPASQRSRSRLRGRFPLIPCGLQRLVCWRRQVPRSSRLVHNGPRKRHLIRPSTVSQAVNFVARFRRGHPVQSDRPDHPSPRFSGGRRGGWGKLFGCPTSVRVDFVLPRGSHVAVTRQLVSSGPVSIGGFGWSWPRGGFVSHPRCHLLLFSGPGRLPFHGRHRFDLAWYQEIAGRNRP